MCTTQEYIDRIQRNADFIRNSFAVESLSIFGSVARGQQNEDSDVDVFVEMPARMFLLIGLKQYLEELLGCSVDVIRNHQGLNTYLKQEIEQDGIPVFKAA